MASRRCVVAGMVVLGAVLAAGLGGCSKKPAGHTGGTNLDDVVMTSFYPAAYFARRIADGAIEVRCPLPDDADPAFWQPTPEVIGAYQHAKLIVLNGAEFEKWALRADLPRSRIVDTTAGMHDELIQLDKAFTHSHGTAGTHSHKGLDGHTWVSPAMARRQAQAIHDAMVRVWPEHKARFDTGATALDHDLEGLSARLEALSPAMEGVGLLASHPAYNYLARDLGWTVSSLGLVPDEPLDEAELAEIGRLLDETPGSARRIMLWEAPPLEATATLLDERFGLISVVFSPCEADPGPGEDYLSVMNANIDRLAEAVTRGSP